MRELDQAALERAWAAYDNAKSDDADDCEPWGLQAAIRAYLDAPDAAPTPTPAAQTIAEAVHAWVREDASTGVKITLTHDMERRLIERVSRASRAHDGGVTRDEVATLIRQHVSGVAWIEGHSRKVPSTVGSEDAADAILSRFSASHAGDRGRLEVTTAAMRFEDGLVVTMPRPHRHGSLINRTYRERGETRDHGFMLTDGSYVDRKRAYEVAEAAGQIAFPHAEGSLYKPYSLFTEHLWADEPPLAPAAGQDDAGEGVTFTSTSADVDARERGDYSR